MMPALPPLQMAANSSARGGEFTGGGGGLMQGDWIITGGGDNGLNTNTVLIGVAAVGAVLWFMQRKKSA